jgi:hypothetical protein
VFVGRPCWTDADRTTSTTSSTVRASNTEPPRFRDQHPDFSNTLTRDDDRGSKWAIWRPSLDSAFHSVAPAAVLHRSSYKVGRSRHSRRRLRPRLFSRQFGAEIDQLCTRAMPLTSETHER